MAGVRRELPCHMPATGPEAELDNQNREQEGNNLPEYTEG